jgi:hypothetical protein
MIIFYRLKYIKLIYTSLVCIDLLLLLLLFIIIIIIICLMGCCFDTIYFKVKNSFFEGKDGRIWL